MNTLTYGTRPMVADVRVSFTSADPSHPGTTIGYLLRADADTGKVLDRAKVQLDNSFDERGRLAARGEDVARQLLVAERLARANPELPLQAMVDQAAQAMKFGKFELQPDGKTAAVQLGVSAADLKTAMTPPKRGRDAGALAPVPLYEQRIVALDAGKFQVESARVFGATRSEPHVSAAKANEAVALAAAASFLKSPARYLNKAASKDNALGA